MGVPHHAHKPRRRALRLFSRGSPRRARSNAADCDRPADRCSEESGRRVRARARLCGPGGGLLLGADLRKDPRILEAAYNDSQGVTAAFNRNILVRINRERGIKCRLEKRNQKRDVEP